jgi:hypothetical protein
MSWATTTLTTSATLAAHEKEIATQAGSTSRWSIYVAAGTTVKVSTTAYATCTYATFTYSDASTANVNVVASEITLPTAKYIIQIDLYNVSNVLLYSFPLTEGFGATLTSSTSSTKTLVTYTSTGNWTGWENTTTDGDFSWADKITLAKTQLGHAIETALTERGYSVDEANSKVLLDVITNPETFNIASDYLTLHLIYFDLSNGGFNELFESKAKLYEAKYNKELSACMRRLNLDPSLSGTTSTYRAELVGYLSR